MPEDQDVHPVMDNYATYKTPRVKAWLARRPHWQIHFTPTSASWLNQVERWFAELTRKQILRDELRNLGVQGYGANARSMFDIEAPPLDWVSLARGHGVPATRVETIDGLAAAFAAGMRDEGPSLIELVCP